MSRAPLLDLKTLSPATVVVLLLALAVLAAAYLGGSR